MDDPTRHPAARTAVVLPNLDGASLLPMVLGSLSRLDGPPPEVVVVDNGSSDGSLELLARDHPEVRVLALGRNEGFAAAVNRGVDATTGEYVALLNTDVEVEPDWLAALVRTLDARPTAGSVASKMLLHGDRTRFDAAGDELSRSGVPHPRSNGRLDVGQHEREEEVFGARGGAALYRRSAWEDVGGFDESFFAYCEDVDWALRAHLRRWSCVYVPSAVAYHMGSATTNRTSARARHFYAVHRRNICWMLVKGLPGPVLLRVLPQLVVGQLLLLALSVRDGLGAAHLGAWRMALRGVRPVLRARREVQRRRTAPPAALLAVLSPELLPGRGSRRA